MNGIIQIIQTLERNRTEKVRNLERRNMEVVREVILEVGVDQVVLSEELLEALVEEVLEVLAEAVPAVRADLVDLVAVADVVLAKENLVI